MNRNLLSALFLLVLLVTACTSNKEITFKVHPDYSDKITTDFAIDLITFAKFAHEYNRIAFKDGTSTEKEESIVENLNSILSDISSTLETLSSDELAIYQDMLSYSLNIHVMTMLKANHQMALINNEIGLTEKDEYLDIIDSLQKMKENSNEDFEKLKAYVIIK